MSNAKLRETPMAFFINEKCVGCTKNSSIGRYLPRSPGSLVTKPGCHSMQPLPGSKIQADPHRKLAVGMKLMIAIRRRHIAISVSYLAEPTTCASSHSGRESTVSAASS